MFEKVNPAHPDKVADRIAGRFVDYVYNHNKKDNIAVEVLIGHGVCHIIIETSSDLDFTKVSLGDLTSCQIDLTVVPQDTHLHDNQQHGIRCGDNGIFKGMPVTSEQQTLTDIAGQIYKDYPSDGKYIYDQHKLDLIICQSNAPRKALALQYRDYGTVQVNPLGDWSGGTDVDCGATNRKLGSDMGDSITGGGLHGKDLSKADVAVNIYAFLEAQLEQKPITLYCAIGDTYVTRPDKVTRIPYSEIVAIAEKYINRIGGFEKFAEWGLINPTALQEHLLTATDQQLLHAMLADVWFGHDAIIVKEKSDDDENMDTLVFNDPDDEYHDDPYDYEYHHKYFEITRDEFKNLEYGKEYTLLDLLHDQRII